jgi:hypothetical protein
MTLDFYCKYTGTLVERNGMRPGYDCRCSGCMAWLATRAGK